MARLLVHVEGQTEETFVTEVLRDHLACRGFHSVEPRIVGNARIRGGIRPWPSVRKDVCNHLREDRRCIATTMVDYFGLPRTGAAGWPGRDRSGVLRTAEEKARCVEDALRIDVARESGDRFDLRRFVPFVMMHEFESLLFSDCAAFGRLIARPDLEAQFKSIRQQFATPEDINDSPETAPSKRVGALVPGYQKPFLGVLAILEIGLATIRSECPHFDGWLAS